MINKIKIILLSNKFVYKTNALIKARSLKRQLNFLDKKYNNTYYSNLSNQLFAKKISFISKLMKKKDTQRLNILWIGVIQSQDESGILPALRRVFKVTEFNNYYGKYGLEIHPKKDESETLMRKRNDIILLEILKANNYDLILGQFWHYALSSLSLNYAKIQKIPVINISMDDKLGDLWFPKNGITRGSVGLMECVDLTLTTSPEAVNFFAGHNMASTFFPLASSPDIFYNKTTNNRAIDILFIGNKYGIRGEIIKKLQISGLDVVCFGKGWGTKYLDTQGMASVSKSAKIIIGVGTVGYSKDVFTLKLRDFDSVMSGALYITHRNPTLDELFGEGVGIECYGDIDELKNKISYYLTHNKKRLKIAKLGQEIAVRRHTWDIRIQYLIKDILQIG